MLKLSGVVLMATLASSHAIALAPDLALIASNLAGPTVPAQYGRGGGPGLGDGGGPVRCRVVRVPGSGMGPQRVCSRPAMRRCRIIRIPGSGLGPQRVCD